MKITTHEGIINLDTEEAKDLGFTSDKFRSSYLFKKGNEIWISMIWSLGDGNFSKLMKIIHELGFTLKIPTPLGKMKEIVKAKGFLHSREFVDELGEEINIWTKAP